jgi:competence protein CoiA
MQLYALENNLPIFSTHAVRHKDYYCPECKAIVRLRKGPYRKPHFYHPSASSGCSQHKKSLAHLQSQLRIQDLLPSGEGQMEKPFPEIARIADVAWEQKKIVFEIQCSPISFQEAQQRSRDYQKLGYTPVWILHDRRFNKRRLSASEDLLRKCGCYYTNIDEKGHGEFYDQFDICSHNRRIFRGSPLKVDLRHPSIFQLNEKNLPQVVLARLENWRLSFLGDLISLSQKNSTDSLFEIEKKFLKPLNKIHVLKRFYLGFFRMMLEKFCG